MISEKTPGLDLQGDASDRADEAIPEEDRVRFLEVWNVYRTNGSEVQTNVLAAHELSRFIKEHRHWAEQKCGPEEVAKFSEAYSELGHAHREEDADNVW